MYPAKKKCFKPKKLLSVINTNVISAADLITNTCMLRSKEQFLSITIV